ncbi:MAG: hypothetical protein HDR34_00270 [Treponema sp.]|nr:hypothetical protein [Treponema sp.]
MKIRIVPALIAFGVSALAGYGFYAANAKVAGNEAWIMLVVSAVSFFVTLGGGFGIRYREGESVVGITVLSVLAEVIHLVINLVATFAPFRAAPYIITSGIVLLAYVGIVYAMSRAFD